jgi:hypothetical protein
MLPAIRQRNSAPTIFVRGHNRTTASPASAAANAYTGRTCRTPISMLEVRLTRIIAIPADRHSYARALAPRIDSAAPSPARARNASGVFTSSTTGKKYHQPWRLTRPNK